MNTDRLYEYLVLSKALNYSKAAQVLFISQSILSRHIQELEAELGVRLLLRDTHSVQLTDAGRLLADRCGALINTCNSAVTLLRTQSAPAAGTIRILCGEEIARASHIRSFISQFIKRYPRIAVDFEVRQGNAPPELTQSADFLLTPCDYRTLPPTISQHLIYTQGTYAILPAGHPLMAKSLVPLHLLAGETLIVPYADEFFGPYMQNWQLIDRSTHGRINCLKAPNLATALFMVSIGRGICVAPRYARDMAPDGCFGVGISDASCRFREFLYYNTGRGNSAAKIFYEEFSNTFQQV